MMIMAVVMIMKMIIGGIWDLKMTIEITNRDEKVI